MCASGRGCPRARAPSEPLSGRPVIIDAHSWLLTACIKTSHATVVELAALISHASPSRPHGLYISHPATGMIEGICGRLPQNEVQYLHGQSQRSAAAH